MNHETTDVLLLDPNQPAFSAEDVLHLLHEHYGIRGDVRFLTSERDQAVSVRVLNPSGHIPEQVVLKVSNIRQPDEVVDLQTAALAHIALSDPALPVPRVIADREGRRYCKVDFATGGQHAVHVLSFLPGSRLSQRATAQTATIRRHVGEFVARLDRALQGFFHPASDHEHPWNFAHCLRFRDLTSVIADKAGRRGAEAVFERASEHVIPLLAALRQQLIHHDAHSDNLLVAPDRPESITGLIDFGDVLYGALAAELAVACQGVVDPGDGLVGSICDVVAGYDSVSPLEESELELLYDLVCLRCALTAVIAATRLQHHAGRQLNDLSPAPSIELLKQLLAIGRHDFERELRKACRFPVYCPRSASNDTNAKEEERLIKARAAFLGRGATHFYDRPMHFERARGPWLYSTDGHRYLDCYNNVPQVGHCHPHVTRAIARQAAALNTNSRYVYSSAVEYAERLTSKLAPHLDACLFVNSGSEANDVAWQIARVATGKRGALIMEDAYHGITDAMRQFSPGHPDTRLPPFLKGLRVPDPYRGPYRDGEPGLVEKYATDAARAIAELDESGHGIAAFFVDSAMCSSGVPGVPDGYLRAVETRVRAAGGLFIADEVQSGFGRMGQWWGHERHGVRADIVTMGKPVGNGHPLGVVVTTQEILNRFMDNAHLFSTFGGNTVACAAGNAVLDVLENEDLIENGRVTGTYLREQLTELAKRQSLIGDVRGCGMISGVELVTDRAARTPASDETRRLLELMRQNRVLVGSDGRDANILKLRPCLAFRHEHVDRFIDALDRSLGAL